MSKVEVHPKPLVPPDVAQNPLPQLLQTPSGLALLEMQGTINLPSQDDEDSIIATDSQAGVASQETPIGRLVFPDWDPEKATETKWMKRVYLYVGKHQRLTGEVKKLPKALAVIRKRKGAEMAQEEMDLDQGGEGGERTEHLEVVEILKYKILFSIRPEPVGTWAVGDGI
ncbi:hypothetical protein LZ554_005860 [Drepanopeziza brunnea f. sp. 'monogermtubi']|nr:hypothetical protein LZ554_005860 [Drepanopeziza brunnea f. sp. 'monogermtubi']